MYIRDPCEDDTLPKEKHTGLADSLFNFVHEDHTRASPPWLSQWRPARANLRGHPKWTLLVIKGAGTWQQHLEDELSRSMRRLILHAMRINLKHYFIYWKCRAG